jgi:propanol-preferring alcohol dehydrogenase
VAGSRSPASTSPTFPLSTTTSISSRRDGEEFLALAAQIPIRPTTTEYPFEKADIALEDLARDAVRGAAVIRVAGDH